MKNIHDFFTTCWGKFKASKNGKRIVVVKDTTQRNNMSYEFQNDDGDVIAIVPFSASASINVEDNVITIPSTYSQEDIPSELEIKLDIY